MSIELISLVVRTYDEAISFFVDVLDFNLVEDSPSLTNDGRPKRWVVVRPPKGETGLLLAEADGDDQISAIGNQTSGRVGFFLRVDDFDATYQKMVNGNVSFGSPPPEEANGNVAVFCDIVGNRWDLLG